MTSLAKLMYVRRWAVAAACFAAILCGAPAAVAQDEEDERIEEITVTGSRLVRRDLDAPSPVVVVSEAAIRSAGNVTIEETLNEMPQLASDNTSSVNSGGGSGILTADLRGERGGLHRPEQHPRRAGRARRDHHGRRLGGVRVRRHCRRCQLHPQG
jgi:outer membrane receptor protein involved in Fe transport